MNQLPAVAKKVFYACAKCETDRYQVVMAHLTENTAKLECEVCKTKNSFKLEDPAKKFRSTAAKKKPSKARAAKTAGRWADLSEKNNQTPSPYNMKASFETGSVLKHPKFGLGFVISVNGQSMNVIFEDAERALVHGRQ
jgi:hypothetical protein